tara:strand:+ start:145 stop:495 length:351 start_codon:yes stop_codon:yes gene_type:complete
MEKISLYKSSTGHYFEKRETCEAWKKRVSAHEAEVIHALKDDLRKSDDGTFPEEFLKLILESKLEETSQYLSTLAKINYWFNNSPLNYDEGFICFKDKEYEESSDWLNKHRSKLMD